MKSYWLDVTPAMARDYLAAWSQNRSLSATLVATYSRDMESGSWLPSPQGLIFDQAGHGRDGHHRMAALSSLLDKRPDLVIRFWVTDLDPGDPDIYPVLDTGRARTFANRLFAEGWHDYTAIAAVVRKVYDWDEGQPWYRHKRPSREELHRVLEKHDDEIQAAAKFSHRWSGNAVMTPGLAAFCWYLFRECDAEEADTFMSGVEKGNDLPDGSPILALRERLIGRHREQRGERSGHAPSKHDPAAELWLAITAWNQFRARRSLKLLKLGIKITNDNFPRPV